MVQPQFITLKVSYCLGREQSGFPAVVCALEGIYQRGESLWETGMYLQSQVETGWEEEKKK